VAAGTEILLARGDLYPDGKGHPTARRHLYPLAKARGVCGIEGEEFLCIVLPMHAIVAVRQLPAIHHEILGLAVFLLPFHQGPGHPAVGYPGGEAGTHLLALVVTFLKTRIE